ncbi:RecA-like DNA recombinase [Brevibacterium phage Cantare]|uniref:RecA-like DNA recombinase n=1 Tax=Brevibacterium phage Cantare TaxID=2338395 RepID=A0A3G3LYT7_9CAUD|nr:DNA recombinase [Brevibacterium phage Cantare]AYQ99288.1 RecA-like DNA recombinase [Brevibacterium phage Cantare]
MALTAQELQEAVNAKLGKGTVTMASDDKYKTEFVSTGLLPFDILLQGGIPTGRFTTIYGDYSTLKSYVGLNAIREFQTLGKTCAYIDLEHSFSTEWAESVGVNVKDLIVERPATGERAVDIMEVLIRGGIDFIVFDSIASALPLSEQDKMLSEDKIQPGRIADLMSKAMRKLTASNERTAVLFINQTREKIGITFGSNESLPGGKAVPFYSSYMISARKTGKLTKDIKFYDGDKWASGKEQIGQKYKIELVKSKLNKPFRDMWFTWSLTKGQIDLPAFLLAQGVESGLIEVTGNTWVFENVRAVGRQKFADALASDADALMVLEDRIRMAHGLEARYGLVIAPGSDKAPEGVKDAPQTTAKRSEEIAKAKRAKASTKLKEPVKKATARRKVAK